MEHDLRKSVAFETDWRQSCQITEVCLSTHAWHKYKRDTFTPLPYYIIDERLLNHCMWKLEMIKRTVSINLFYVRNINRRSYCSGERGITSGERSVLTLGSLCPPCCVRDTAFNIVLKFFSKLTQTWIAKVINIGKRKTIFC